MGKAETVFAAGAVLFGGAGGLLHGLLALRCAGLHAAEAFRTP